MKRILSLFVAFAMLIQISVTVFASKGSENIYEYNDNTMSFLYFIDNEGRPYICNDSSEIQYALVPLDTAIVTDKDLIDELNNSIPKLPERSVPSSYYDMRAVTGNGLRSISYTTFVNFELMSTVTTPALRVNTSFSCIKVRTDNMVKTLLSGKKIKLTIYFYSLPNDNWYNYTYEANYTGNGLNYTFSPSVTPYIKYKIQKSSSGVKNFDFVTYTFANT